MSHLSCIYLFVYNQQGNACECVYLFQYEQRLKSADVNAVTITIVPLTI